MALDVKDERVELRLRLLGGRWQHLVDPLLPLVLLEDASWWALARARCASQLVSDTPQQRADVQETWVLRLRQARLEHGDASPAAVAVQIAWSRACCGKRAGYDAHRAALDVLASYPVG